MEFLTGNEAATYLGVHTQTIKKWRKSGKIVPQQERLNLTLYSKEYLDEVKKKYLEKNPETP